MKTKTFVKVLGYVAAFAVGFAVMFWVCRCTKQPAEVVTVTNTVTKYVDSSKHTAEAKEPVPIYIKADTSKIVAKYERLLASAKQQGAQYERERDSLFLLVLDYYAERQYDTVLVNDSSLHIRIRWVTWQNKTETLIAEWINRRPIKIESIQQIINNCRTRFYLGFDLNYTFGAKVPITLGGGFLIVSKGIWAGGASYDPFTKTVSLRNYFRVAGK